MDVSILPEVSKDARLKSLVFPDSRDCELTNELAPKWRFVGETQRPTNKCSGGSQDCCIEQILLKGEVSLYQWPPVWLVWNQLHDYWQILFLFAKQTNPNQSNRRSTVQWYFPLQYFLSWAMRPSGQRRGKGGGDLEPVLVTIASLLNDKISYRTQCSVLY